MIDPRPYQIKLSEATAQLESARARQRPDQDGDTPEEAATAAARIRLRPILMTSLAFILGVFPLAVATGAGAEMRQSLGTAVFSGMLGVTVFGLAFTPVFYTFIRKLGGGVAHDPKSSSDGGRNSAKNSQNPYSDVQREAPGHSQLPDLSPDKTPLNNTNVVGKS